MSRAKKIIESLNEGKAKEWVQSKVEQLMSKASELYKKGDQVTVVYKDSTKLGKGEESVSIIPQSEGVPKGYSVVMSFRKGDQQNKVAQDLEKSLMKLPVLPVE